MLGNFINRTLLLGVGYAYPAFECFKTLEKNRVGIEELKSWGKYWIIMALLTVIERPADVFISWLPFYGELKLALIIYLLHTNFSGTGHVYDTIIQPFLAKHENDIDRSMAEDVVLRGVSCLANRSGTPPPINTSRDMKKQESARLFSALEPSTPGSSRLSRSMPASHATAMSPDSQADFVYIDDHELEEAKNNHNPDPKSTPNKCDDTDWDNNDPDIDHADSNASMATIMGRTDGLKHGLHLRGLRHRPSAAV